MSQQPAVECASIWNATVQHVLYNVCVCGICFILRRARVVRVRARVCGWGVCVGLGARCVGERNVANYMHGLLLRLI